MGNSKGPTLRTDQKLLDALRRGAETKLSPSEYFEQKVSFVFASLDKDSVVTREQVKDAIKSHEGGGIVGA